MNDNLANAKPAAKCRGRFVHRGRRGERRRAFTLVEIVVVIAIIGMLLALLLPALTGAIDEAKRAMCLSNLHQIGLAVYSYANSNQGVIPYGPTAPPMMTAADFCPATGTPTSLISLSNGQPVALGLLLDGYLRDPRVLFCPGSDQSTDSNAQLALVGKQQAQCSYYYRHGSVAKQYDRSPNGAAYGDIKLSNLGYNRNNQRIVALAIDTQFTVPASFQGFGITSLTHHRTKLANILWSDGSAVSSPNTNGRYTVDLSDYGALTHAFSVILSVLETADAEKSRRCRVIWRSVAPTK